MVAECKISKLSLIVLTVITAIFLPFYSYLAIDGLKREIVWSRQIFNSPDETANYFFASLFAKESSLKFTDPLNSIGQGLIAPRSMRVINAATAPAGFLGLPIIYGSLAKVFGQSAIPFFTPVLAIVGLIFFFLLIKSFFNERTAQIAVALTAILPPFWYYSAKSLMPNIAFVSFFIIALFFLRLALRHKILVYYLLFGATAALALMVRPAEVVWLFPLVLFCFIINWRKIKFWPLLASLGMFILIFSPILYFNNQIYGSPFSIGYSFKSAFASESLVQSGITLLGSVFLPFGFHPAEIVKNLFNYTSGLFPIWTFLFFLGWLIFFSQALIDAIQGKKYFKLLYFLAFAALGGYLAIYYGSWNFHDNPDPSAITIGTSYARYFLPLYLFSIPPFAFVLQKFVGRFKLVFPVFAVFLFLSLFLVSYGQIVLERPEGLNSVKKNLAQYQQIAKVVLEKTEPDAVIIAGRLDKAFFPSRRVIFKLNNGADYARIKELIGAGYPVYVFDFTLKTDEDLKFMNQRDFEPYGLKLEPSVAYFETQSLYPLRIKFKANEQPILSSQLNIR